MMIALAAQRDLPVVLVPRGVALPPTDGKDAGTIQTAGARYAHDYWSCWMLAAER